MGGKLSGFSSWILENPQEEPSQIPVGDQFWEDPELCFKFHVLWDELQDTLLSPPPQAFSLRGSFYIVPSPTMVPG